VIRDWAVWAVLRLGLLAIILGWVPWPEQVNDLAIYQRWAEGPLAGGTFPTDPMWQYPPLAGPIFRLGAMLPGERIGFALLFLAFDAAIMLMLSWQAARSRRTAGRTLWAWSALITGPLLLARFDVVPTALALAAILVTAPRPAASGALAGIGAWLKAWPILVLSGVRRGDLPRAIAGVVAASLCIVVVLVVTTDQPFGFLTGQAERGLQVESVAAWPFLVARAFGADVAVVYQYGAHEVVADGVPVVAAGSIATTLALLGLVAVQRLRGALEDAAAADVALATVLFSVVTSRVFSTQYFIWLLALGAACLGTSGTRMRRCVMLVVASGAASQLVYPWLYTALLEGRPWALLAQTARVGLAVGAAVLAVGVLVTPRPVRWIDGVNVADAGVVPGAQEPPAGPA
jgi:hypothetical protein